MKGLKKLALASAVAAVSAGAQAELKALDDSALGELTGQAGLTIDVETKYTIGEFQYKDAGSVFLTGLSLGGNTNSAETNFRLATNGGVDEGYLDNYRIYIDIAGGGASDATNTQTEADGYKDNNFNYGFSRIADLAAVHVKQGNTDADIIAASEATTNLAGTGVSTNGTTGGAIDGRKDYNDGDLVIHFSFTDAWQKGGGYAAYLASSGTFGFGGTAGAGMDTVTYAQALDIGTRAVDFNFNIDAIGIAASNFVTGQTALDVQGTAASDINGHKYSGLDVNADTTVLISELSINGYLGPADLLIQNNGNGFSGGPLGIPGTGEADSKIIWGSYFRITDLDVYIDIAGVYLKDIEIANTRGDKTGLDGTDSIGFAHSRRTIYAVKDAVIDIGNKNGGANGTNGANPLGGQYVDGLALNTEFKGDIDIGAIEFGDTGLSIGELFITDMQSDTKWTISAH
jgi:hypothetical protein